MINNVQTKTPFLLLKTLVFITACLFLSGCNDNNEKNEIKKITQLSNSNITDFTQHISDDYFKHLDSLLTGFKTAQAKDDANAFIIFRNAIWTPSYINDKEYYSSVFSENKTYLKTSPVAPVFSLFENLIYIGLELKNGLINGDNDSLKKAIDEAQADKKRMNTILLSAGLSTHP